MLLVVIRNLLEFTGHNLSSLFGSFGKLSFEWNEDPLWSIDNGIGTVDIRPRLLEVINGYHEEYNVVWILMIFGGFADMRLNQSQLVPHVDLQERFIDLFVDI